MSKKRAREAADKPAKERKIRVILPLETLAEAAALADVDGLEAASRFYGVHPMTISRARVKIASRPDLQAIVAHQKEELTREWRKNALRFVRTGLDVLTELVKHAKPEQIRDVAGAVHLVAGKLIVKDMFPDAKRPRPGRADSVPPAAARAASGGAGTGVVEPPVH